MNGWVLVALVACGCGRLAFDPIGDGGAGDDAMADAAIDGPAITARHWVNRNDGAPGRLLSPKLTFHAQRGTVILYGGYDESAAERAAMWELTSTGWALLCDPCAPGRRFHAGFAYDPDRNVLVLISGTDGATTFADHWEWDGTWHLVGAGPSARIRVQMQYDPDRKVMVAIGGVVGPSLVANQEVFELDAGAWASVVSPVGPVHIGGFGSEITYDEKNHRMLALHDQARAANVTDLDDLWSWNGQAWTQICTACSGLGRSSASIVYDPDLQRPWLFGGFGRAGNAEIAGAWQLVNSAWVMVDPLVGGRDSIGVAYDAKRRVIVTYGGNGPPCGGNCAQTWELIGD